jgi:hypothetical protein
MATLVAQRKAADTSNVLLTMAATSRGRRCLYRCMQFAATLLRCWPCRVPRRHRSSLGLRSRSSA